MTPEPLCTVYFRDATSGRVAGHTTNARSAFAAVRLAWAFFHAAAWQGPRPTLATVCEVRTPTAGPFYVRCERALAAPLDPPPPATPSPQASLFPRAPEPD